VGLAIFVITTQLAGYWDKRCSGNFVDIIGYYLQHLSEISVATMALAAMGFAFLYLGNVISRSSP